MTPPKLPFQPYAAVHQSPQGAGDARPTAEQILRDCNAIDSMQGKSILITGAASGIGVTTAAALYKTGAQLFLAARDIVRTEQVIGEIVPQNTGTKTPRPIAVELHLDSFASVRRAAEAIKSLTATLHIVINNAGIMFVPLARTEDGFESHLAVNHLSHFLLFHELRPLLLASTRQGSSKARIINVSSSGHRFSPILFEDWNFERSDYESTIAYGQSKTANIYMADTLTRIHGNRDGIISLSVHPGVITTTGVYRHMSDSALQDLDSKRDHAQVKSPEQGAATTVWAAVSPYFEDVEHGGRYLADLGECAPMEAEKTGVVGVSGYAPFAYDEGSADRLWRMSCRAVGVESEI